MNTGGFESFNFNLSLFPSSPSADGESSLQEYSSEREGDADLLYLHGEEQQEPLGPERRRRQTAGLNLPTTSRAAVAPSVTGNRSDKQQRRLFSKPGRH